MNMVTYEKLWETMKAKNITQYRLIKYYGISAGQIGRLKKNMYVSTHTLDVLCNILRCPVEDIMEIRLDDVDYELKFPDEAAAPEQSSKNKRRL